MIIETPSQKIGFTAWLLQRVTAILIIFVLTVHFWYQHFSSVGEIGLWESIVRQWGIFSYIMLDGLLLAFTLFHGLNGIRMIALDYPKFFKRERLITVSLAVFGLITFFLGLRALFILFS